MRGWRPDAHAQRVRTDMVEHRRRELERHYPGCVVTVEENSEGKALYTVRRPDGTTERRRAQFHLLVERAQRMAQADWIEGTCTEIDQSAPQVGP